MTAAGGASSLATLAKAVATSQPENAGHAALEALKAKTPPLEVLRSAAVTAATHYDGGSGVAPRGLALLASAAHLSRPIPVLQAVTYAASEPRSAVPSRPPAVVAGEITHLGRSFLFGVRAGDLAEAEPIFLGMVHERSERKMAGDMLFRAALEDMGDGGRKLFIAVRSWQLAKTLGFKDARTVLRPAVQYLVQGVSDRTAYETIMKVLGKEWVDFESLGSGGRPLDAAGHGKVAALAASESAEACVASTLALLREGYAAASVAEGLVTEAARRVLTARGFDLETARGLLFAHAARFVLTFSRTNERLYALFQAALRVRSPAADLALPSVADASREEDALRHLAAALDTRKPLDAAAHVRAYLARGWPADRLLEVLADHACRDSCAANEGINLLLADASAVEYRMSKAPEVPMALAKTIAASPKDTRLYEAWSAALGP